MESNTLVFGLARLQQEIATIAGRLEDARADLDEVLVDEVEIELGEEVYESALKRAQERAIGALVDDRSSEETLSVREVATILASPLKP